MDEWGFTQNEDSRVTALKFFGILTVLSLTSYLLYQMYSFDFEMFLVGLLSIGFFIIGSYLIRYSVPAKRGIILSRYTGYEKYEFEGESYRIVGDRFRKKIYYIGGFNLFLSGILCLQYMISYSGKEMHEAGLGEAMTAILIVILLMANSFIISMSINNLSAFRDYRENQKT